MPDWTLSCLGKSLDIYLMNLNPLFQDNRSETQSFGANMKFSITCPSDCHQSCSPTVWSTRGCQPTMQTLTVNSNLACTTWKYIALIFSPCRCELSPTHLLGCTFQTLKHPAVHFVQNWLLLHSVNVTIFDSTHPRTTRWKHSSLFFQGIDSKSLFTPDGRSGNA